jgi:hypothetical protein
MNPSIRLDVDEGRGFQVLWEDDELVFCRRRRRSGDGERGTVLAVLPAMDRPTPANLDRWSCM